jgi:hypothetical protein
VLETSSAVRRLGPADLPHAIAVAEREPLVDVFAGSRLHSSGLAPSRAAGEFWGFDRDGRLASLCYSGANLVPVQASAPAAHAFADLAARRGRRCSSMVGPVDSVLAMWDVLRPEWGPAREVRASQPVLAMTHVSPLAADPRVRRLREDEVDLLMPAAVAMFTEEVGVSPIGNDGGLYYRARLAELVRTGRAFAIVEDGEIVFKAEIGAVTRHAGQIQGVWVRPDRRGHGLSAGGMAALVQIALREIAPAVSLYVNDFNVAARRIYARVGFHEVARFATVLF